MKKGHFGFFCLIVVYLLQLQGCSKSDSAQSAATPEYPDIKQYFDAAYVAPESYQDNSGSSKIADNTPARFIKDIIGDKHLIWKGADVPSPMWPTPPVFHVDENTGGPKPTGYILVHNVSNTYWDSNTFTAIPQPYDVYVVLRDLEAVNFEGYFSRSLGLRNRGDHLQIGIIAPNQASSTNVDMNTPTVLEFNKISIVRIQFDGSNSKLWINNQIVQPGAVNIDGSYVINQMGYGTNSHAAQHDFFGMWVKFGKLSDSDASTIYSTLATFYNVGKYPTKPIANNIRAVWNPSTKSWDAKYDFVGDGTNPEDPAKAEFQWGYRDLSKDLNTSAFFSGGSANSKSLKRSDFPSIITFPGQAKASLGPGLLGQGVTVFVAVKVYDTKGNSWNHLVRSPPTIDEVP